MADVTFNSVTIPFGKVRGEPHEWVNKEWKFPGVDGSNAMDLGFARRVFSVRGMSKGGAITKATLEGMIDGTNHTLQDGGGNTFGNCQVRTVAYTDQWTENEDGSPVYCFAFELSVVQLDL